MAALWRLAIIALLFPSSADRAQQHTSSDNERALERLATGEHIKGLPPADSISLGARRIPAGTLVHGVIVARGPIDVAGTVEGTVISLGGDVIVHRGGIVRGDALSVGGRVIADGGVIDGEMRGVSSLPTVISATALDQPRTPAQQTVDAVKLVAGTFGILFVVAIGVLLFAGHNLDEVVSAVERRFGRAFWTGVLGQLLILPGLCLLLLALGLTVVGILLWPFAIVAYGVIVAGMVTLGFLAVARLVGGAIWRAPGADVRVRALGALASGLAIFFVLWTIAALLVWAPLAATVVRAAALAATWAAMTVGLGAAMLSRAGTHRRVTTGGPAVELAAWQTPTPLTGVAAARRPTAAARETQ